MTKTVHLELARLPLFVATPLYCCIDSETEQALTLLTDTFARLRCACRFLQRFGASAKDLNVHDDELLLMWAGYLRAALMEYAGMEESSRADMRRLGFGHAAVAVDDTRNAMLILLRELRNLHIHVTLNRFEVARRHAILRTLRQEPNEAAVRALGLEENTEVTIVTIPRIDLDQMLTSRAAKRFDKTELFAAIQWLDEAQGRWGIRDVVLAALDEYSDVLVQALAADTLHDRRQFPGEAPWPNT